MKSLFISFAIKSYLSSTENNGLEGTIPSELGQIQSTEALWLSEFAISHIYIS